MANLDPEIQPEKDVRLQVWDTAGEERFRSLTHMYYRDAVAIILSFSLADAKSFESLETWLDEIEEKVQLGNFLKILVGTKSDLENQREVSIAQASKFADDNGWVFMETSAKANTNVHQLFTQIASQLYTIEVSGGFQARKTQKGDTKKLKGKKRGKKKAKKGCC